LAGNSRRIERVHSLLTTVHRLDAETGAARCRVSRRGRPGSSCPWSRRRCLACPHARTCRCHLLGPRRYSQYPSAGFHLLRWPCQLGGVLRSLSPAANCDRHGLPIQAADHSGKREQCRECGESALIRRSGRRAGVTRAETWAQIGRSAISTTQVGTALSSLLSPWARIASEGMVCAVLLCGW
jgi:hypothetical protein